VHRSGDLNEQQRPTAASRQPGGIEEVLGERSKVKEGIGWAEAQDVKPRVGEAR
jgi:hypothetical protein